jgi:mRNA interferase MazF
MVSRGELWLAKWPNDPSKKERPLLVVSNNHRNQASALLDIVIVKITSFEKSNGTPKLTNPSEDVIITLKKKSIIRCASVFTIEKTTLTRKLGQIDITQMAQVDACLKNVLDLN